MLQEITNSFLTVNIQEFKDHAGVATLQFFKSASGCQYCPTPVGTLFTGKDYNPKGKIQTILPGYDEVTGRTIYRLTNLVPVMEL